MGALTPLCSSKVLIEFWVLHFEAPILCFRLGLKQIALLLRERLVILDSIVPQTATERPLTEGGSI
jgi:hypothetical protein